MRDQGYICWKGGSGYSLKYKMFLGNDYLIRLDRRLFTCRFIKVTAKGFNLLELETSRC